MCFLLIICPSGYLNMKIVIKIFNFTLDDSFLDAGIREPDRNGLGLSVDRIYFLRFFRRVRMSGR